MACNSNSVLVDEDAAMATAGRTGPAIVFVNSANSANPETASNGGQKVPPFNSGGMGSANAGCPRLFHSRSLVPRLWVSPGWTQRAQTIKRHQNPPLTQAPSIRYSHVQPQQQQQQQPQQNEDLQSFDFKNMYRLMKQKSGDDEKIVAFQTPTTRYSLPNTGVGHGKDGHQLRKQGPALPQRQGTSMSLGSILSAIRSANEALSYTAAN